LKALRHLYVGKKGYKKESDEKVKGNYYSIRSEIGGRKI